VAFIRRYRAGRQPRVENGSRGQITRIDETGALSVTLDGSGREIVLEGRHVEKLRLGYAQHIHREQGATLERAIVLTGGWQTGKESSYVQASRAREGTDWYLARDELGTEGTDLERIDRLAEKMRESRAQTPSIEYERLHDPGEKLDPAVLLREMGIPTAQAEIETGQHIEQEHELGWTR
jgi:ATP-dependent exoDNAse (exonuclease V) alpha subunit